MRLVFLGGSGFIGSRIIHYAEKNNFDYLSIDKTHSDSKKHIYVDLFDFNKLSEILNENDIVFMLAAVHQDNASREDYFKTNVNLTKNLCDLFDLKKIKQVVFFSSVAIYGDNQDIHSSFNEIKPTNLYGQSKYEAEKILNKWKSKNKILQVIRPCAVFGYGSKGNTGRLFKLLKYNIFLFYNNHNIKKSLAFVDNLAKFSLLNLNKNSYVSNYVDKPDLSLKNLIEIISIEKKSRIFKLNINLAFLIAVTYIINLFFDLLKIKPFITVSRLKKLNLERTYAKPNEELLTKDRVDIKLGLKITTKKYYE